MPSELLQNSPCIDMILSVSAAIDCRLHRVPERAGGEEDGNEALEVEKDFGTVEEEKKVEEREAASNARVFACYV